MKKLMMIVAMMAATIATNAQILERGDFAITPKVGMNCSDISGAKDYVDNKFGIAAGVEAEYKFNDWFALSAGAMYEQQGFRLKSAKEDVNTEFINIPVMAKFYIWKGLNAGIGVQTGFMTKAKYDGEDVKDVFNKVDVGLSSSFGYDFPFGLSIDLRYTEGLIDMIDGISPYLTPNNSWESKNKNRTFQLSVAYKIKL